MRTISLFWCIVASCLALSVALLVVPNVWIEGSWAKTILLAGLALGLINFFVKPIINFITLPLRFLTLGLLGLVINIGIIWLIDIMFSDLHIKGLLALFLTSLIVWGVNLFVPRKKKKKEKTT